MRGRAFIQGFLLMKENLECELRAGRKTHRLWVLTMNILFLRKVSIRLPLSKGNVIAQSVQYCHSWTRSSSASNIAESRLALESMGHQGLDKAAAYDGTGMRTGWRVMMPIYLPHPSL